MLYHYTIYCYAIDDVDFLYFQYNDVDWSTARSQLLLKHVAKVLL